MKKILVMILALTLAFSMFSCGSDEQLEPFKAAIAATDPASVSVNVTLASSIGTLNSRFDTVYAEDGSFVLTYEYQEFNSAASSATDGPIKTVSGTVNCDANGNYSDGGAIAGQNAAATGLALDLDNKDLENYSVSADGKVLTVTIPADLSEAVLGVNVGQDSTLVINLAGEKVSSFSLVYTTEQGKVTILCAYN